MGDEVQGVMVSYVHSGPEQAAGIATVSASGLRFCRRWVLTHGSLLAPLAVARDVHSAKGKPILNERFYENLPEMYITCEPGRQQRHQDHAQLERLSRARDPPQEELQHPAYQMMVVTGRVVHVWQCGLLARCVTELLYSWSIGQRNTQQQEWDEQLGRTLLSVLVLVDLEPLHADEKLLRPLSALWDLVRPAPGRGAPLLVRSTPFGCEALLNSETRGAVCGVIGSRPSLLLTDASTALGSEGAPVFALSHNQGEGAGALVGMVACSVSWWRGEWVGLTLVAPLEAVLSTKLRIAPSPPQTPALLPDPALQDALRCIDLTTVLVRCGGSWGSGVYLGQGFVLTCAHVVHKHASEKLSVYCAGVRATAILRYKTRDEVAYDLALLYTNPQSWPHLLPANLPADPPAKGESVVAAGYPFFNEKSVADVKPTVTSGHVSNASPSMLQTSCCVQSGFSGGAIYRVRRENNVRVELIGIIVCNAKTQQTGACYPYINMAVPHTAWQTKLARFLRHKDEKSLGELQSKKELVQAQWRLLPYRSKI